MPAVVHVIHVVHTVRRKVSTLWCCIAVEGQHWAHRTLAF